MNITTAADGGDLVPVGHYQGIIARRNEGMLTTSLRIMNIPGQGTTVNVPVDNEADGEFVSTAETVAYDVDAPAVAKVAMTLVKYTKQVQLSNELLEDEDSQLMAFLNDFVGRGLAKTHNALLMAEAANGTKLADFANTSIAVGKMEEMVGNTVLDPYLDDSGSVAWVMQPSTKWAINAILGNYQRIYTGGENTPPRRGGDLLGYPVYTSAKSPAIGTGLKSVYFGNWAYMGFREAPGLTVLRDPYTPGRKRPDSPGVCVPHRLQDFAGDGNRLRAARLSGGNDAQGNNRNRSNRDACACPVRCNERWGRYSRPRRCTNTGERNAACSATSCAVHAVQWDGYHGKRAGHMPRAWAGSVWQTCRPIST